MFDFLIVGAGFAGSVLAERLASQLGKSCLIVERRNHIGGNAYDRYDEAGVLLHNYGPHYFRTNSQRIIDYLSQFTEWREVEYKILSWTHGRFWQFPINLNTFEQLIGRPSTSEEMEARLAEWRDRHRQSKKLRRCDRFAGRMEALRNVLQKLYAQTMATRCKGSRPLGVREDPDPYESRRSLSLREVPSPAKKRLHRDVPENAEASAD